MAGSVTVRGLDELRRNLRSMGAMLRATSAKAAEVAPASVDLPKAEALVRQGRDVFAVDETLQRVARDAYDERLAQEVERAMSGATGGARGAGGRVGSSAAPLVAAAEAVKQLVQDRIDDVEPTPGGKAPLKAPRRDGSTDHIGRDTGALHDGLVARLTR